MGEIEKPKTIMERVPISAMKLVRDCDGDVDTLLTEFDFEYPAIRCTRDEARQLIQQFTLDHEADELATAPSGTSFLASQTDKLLRSEIVRLAEEQKILTDIANADPNNHYRITHTGEIITPNEARSRLDQVLRRVLEIKKSLADDVKASAKEGDTNQNFQFNFGEVVSDALSNIQSAGNEHPNMVKQVESTASRPAGEN